MGQTETDKKQAAGGDGMAHIAGTPTDGTLTAEKADLAYYNEGSGRFTEEDALYAAEIGTDEREAAGRRICYRFEKN